MVKMLSTAGLLAIFCMASASIAQPASPSITRNALYLHPISLIVSTAIENFPLILAATYERALKPKVAIVLTPTFMQWSMESSSEKLSALQFGLGGGVRRYLAKPTAGIYLQTKVNLGYAALAAEDFSTAENASASGFAVSLLALMVGYKGQWDKIAMFIDFGLGYQYYGASATDVNSDIEMSLSGTGLAVGGGFALGYCF